MPPAARCFAFPSDSKGSDMVRARKRFGQHFLVDQSIRQRIVDLIPAHPPTLLEIGPGQGALTDLLVPRTDYLIGVEFDRDLVTLLRKKYADRSSVEIVQKDILDVQLSDYTSTRIPVIGNIPYNITSPLLDWCTREHPLIQSIVFMVQREMALRLCASPNSSDWSGISIMTQLFFTPTLAFHVPPGCFDPPPEVWSSVIQLTPNPIPIDLDLHSFQQLLETAFAHKRKQLRNNLIPALCTEDQFAALAGSLGYAPTIRAEQLSIDQFRRLHQYCIEHGLKRKGGTPLTMRGDR